MTKPIDQSEARSRALLELNGAADYHSTIRAPLVKGQITREVILSSKTVRAIRSALKQPPAGCGRVRAWEIFIPGVGSESSKTFATTRKHEADKWVGEAEITPLYDHPPAPSAGHAPIDWEAHTRDYEGLPLSDYDIGWNAAIDYLRERMEGKA